MLWMTICRSRLCRGCLWSPPLRIRNCVILMRFTLYIESSGKLTRTFSFVVHREGNHRLCATMMQCSNTRVENGIEHVTETTIPHRISAQELCAVHRMPSVEALLYKIWKMWKMCMNTQHYETGFFLLCC